MLFNTAGKQCHARSLKRNACTLFNTACAMHAL
jgi:hypothetical protein